MKVFAVQIDWKLINIPLNFIIPHLEEKRQDRISRFIHFEDKYRSAVAGLLQTYMVSQYLECPKSINYEYNKFGKPSVSNLLSYEFNLSHSGDWVVGVCDERSIGIDIERIDFKGKVLQSILSDKEKTFLRGLSREEQLPMFYHFWVLKEAYTKAIGQGLNFPFEKVAVKLPFRDKIILHDNVNTWYFKFYSIDADYRMALCSPKKELPQKVTVLTIESLIPTRVYSDKNLYK